MDKSKELLNKLLSNTIEITNPDTEHYDYPETEQYVPVWWIKQVLKPETNVAKLMESEAMQLLRDKWDKEENKNKDD
jgi:hypothetical protein